ncbi:porin [Rhodophyticola porphyridii]|uniref:Porin n=1 Tax=Rhodophyticola porphyridii TaxID=1852017 RepID=A0A3L9Y5I4_9RHOB|nr:porin [Rhodophyticola porphyridii]RMA41386.1 porin [Rhodophyticola porphyridii]
MKLLYFLPAVILSLAGMASAQPLPWTEVDANGFYIDGHAQLTYVDIDMTAIDRLFGADLSAGYVALGGPLTWGVDMDIQTFRADSGDPLTATWFSLFMETDIGQFAVGAPRPAFDDYRPRTPFNDLSLVGAQAQSLTSSNAWRTNLQGDEMPWGLRYDGQIGNLSFGASVHRFDDADMTAVGLAARYRFDETLSLAAGYEESSEPTRDMRAMFASVDVDYGRYGGQLIYSEIGEVDGMRVSMVTASGFFRPIEPLTLSLTLRDISEIDEPYYMVEAEYELGRGAYLSLGAGELLGRQIGELAFGWRF